MSIKRALFLGGVVFVYSFFFLIPHIGAVSALDVDDVRLIFGSGTSAIPQLRTWDNSASSWSVVEDVTSTAATVKWTVNKISPTSSEELVGVFSESGATDTFNLLRWDGSVWSVDFTVTSTPDAAKREFDIEYEARSGDALVVYSNNSTNPEYRTRSGGSWSATSSVFASVPGSGVVQWIELASRPGTNEITLVYSDANSDLFTVTWDGSSWLESTTETTLETSLPAITNQIFDVAYEQVSGDLLVAWGSSPNLLGAVRSPGSTSFATSALVSQTSPTTVNIAPEPGGDRIAVVLASNTDDFRAGMWDGVKWIQGSTPDASAGTPGSGDMIVDVGWVGDTGAAVGVYYDTSDGVGSRLHWAKWTLLTGWVAQSDVTGVSGCSNSTQQSFAVEQFINQDKLMALLLDAGNNLCALTYNGSSWTATNSASAVATSSISSSSSVPFSLAVKNPTSTLFVTTHALGQEANAFTGSGSVTDAELFGFSMNPSGDPITVSQLVFTIATSTGLSNGDFSGVEIIKDTNRDGTISGETTSVGGSGSVSIAGGTITFSTSFEAVSSTHYIFRADVSSLSALDGFKLALTPSNITASPAVVVGTTTLAIHQEAMKTLTFNDALLVYGSALGADEGIYQPKLRTWTNASSSWSNEEPTQPGLTTNMWTIGKASPVFSTGEVVVGVFSNDESYQSGSYGTYDTLTMYRYSGSTWSTDWAVSSTVSSAMRGLDIEYEALSGDAMVVYSNATTNPVYRTRSGGSWSSASNVFSSVPGSGAVQWIELARRPYSNEIALVYADANSDLFYVSWNGTSWDEATTETTLETALAQTTIKVIDAEYEQTTGDLMVVWAPTSNIYYGLKNATSTTFTTGTVLIATTPTFVDLAAQPAGKRMAIVYMSNSDDTRTSLWDGDAWVNGLTVDATTGSPGAGDAMAAVGFVGDSDTAVIAYYDNSDGAGSRLHWMKATSTGTFVQQTDVTSGFSGCSDATQQSFIIEPFTTQDKLMVAMSESGSDLCVLTYDGSSWSVTNSGASLEAELTSVASVPFSIVMSQVQPYLNFSLATSTGSEASTTVTLTVNLSTTTDRTVTFAYAVAASSTATGSGTDYALANGTTSIAAGSSTASLSITVNDDLMDEDNETIVVTLSSSTEASLGTTTQHIYTIEDDDPSPTIQFTLATSTGSESTATATLELSLSASSSRTITVQYSVAASSTATGSGTDYTLANGTSTITAGNTTTSLSIPIVNDISDESNETIVLQLSTSTNATLGTTTQHVYTIEDDDATSYIQFTLATTTAVESVTSASLQLELSSTSSQTITVQYAVQASSTATGSGTDYTLANGTSTISAGNSTTSISLTITNDSLDESDETVVIQLSTPVNATLGTTTQHIYTITDNDSAPTIQFSLATSSNSEASTSVSIQVELSAASGLSTSVQYSVQSSSTATGSGTDYTLANGTSTISSGNTTTSISITIVNDSTGESSETIVLQLATPTNASLGSNLQHVYTIQDNDDATTPVLSSVSSTPGTTTSTITWTTDESASSQVEYGVIPTDLSASTTESDTGTRVTSHSVLIPSLSSCATYYYRVRGSDASSNLSTSSISSFTTVGCTGSVSVESSTSTQVSTSTSATLSHNTLTLEIPSGYATTTAIFQIQKISLSSLVSSVDSPSSYSSVGSSAYVLKALTGITSTLSSFSSSITVKMSYTQDQISSIEASSLRIFKYDGGSWSELSSCSVNGAQNIVSCPTSSFSDFALFGTERSSTGSTGGGGGGIPSRLLSQAEVKNQESEIRKVESKIESASSPSFSFSRNLQLGMTGSDVKNLQMFLNSNGFIIAESGPGSRGNETDKFGSLTKAALIRFQEKYKDQILIPSGLQQGTGYFGTLTRNFIMNFKPSEPSSEPMKTQTLQLSQTGLTRGLRLGDTGDDVLLLQQLLSKDSSIYPEGTISGYFGSLTFRAVQKFQLKYGITTEGNLSYGYVGPKTREKLNEIGR